MTILLTNVNTHGKYCLVSRVPIAPKFGPEFGAGTDLLNLQCNQKGLVLEAIISKKLHAHCHAIRCSEKRAFLEATD